MDNLPGKRRQRTRFRRTQPARTRHIVDDTDRAQDMAVCGRKRRPSVKANMRGAGDKRIVLGTPILGEIRNDEHLPLRHGIGANRLVERRLA